jgi:flagellar hook-associated protein 3 FlgL
MRITQGMIADTVLRNVENNQNRIEQLQSQLTSGSRINKPSDDPIGTARALSFQESITQADQFLSNIDQATGWLNNTDNALGSVTSTLQRARELAVQAASDTTSAQDRSAISAEIQQLQQHTLSLAQSKYGNSYLFAGTASDQPGYLQAQASGPAGVWQGNDNQIPREISPGVTIGVNADSRSVFDPVFVALTQLQTSLATNTSATIRTSIGALDTALNGVLSTRAQVGAKVNRLESQSQRLNEIKVNTSGLLSQVKDVDYAQAITNFSMAQSVYQASLKAGAQAMQQSLLDYLR